MTASNLDGLCGGRVFTFQRGDEEQDTPSEFLQCRVLRGQCTRLLHFFKRLLENNDQRWRLGDFHTGLY